MKLKFLSAIWRTDGIPEATMAVPCPLPAAAHVWLSGRASEHRGHHQKTLLVCVFSSELCQQSRGPQRGLHGSHSRQQLLYTTTFCLTPPQVNGNWGREGS